MLVLIFMVLLDGHLLHILAIKVVMEASFEITNILGDDWRVVHIAIAAASQRAIENTHRLHNEVAVPLVAQHQRRDALL